MRTLTVDGEPRLAPLLVRAAATSGRRAGDLPEVQAVRAGVTIDPARLAAYDRVCGYALRSTLPSTYLHVLTFGLQVTLMADRAFPLALPGLVHVANTLQLRRPVEVGDGLDLAVRAEALRPHDKGAQVDLVAQARVGSELVWTGRSTYLAKGTHVTESTITPATVRAVPAPPDDVVPTARWSVSADAGRRYAEVSGDVNPIHLSALSAKAFGFPRAIAHGMWTAARCLAAIEPRVLAGQPHEARVEFRRPVLLPSRVVLRTRPCDGAWLLGLTSARDGAEHLRAAVEPARD